MAFTSCTNYECILERESIEVPKLRQGATVTKFMIAQNNIAHFFVFFKS
jgi:hypothetical protein